MAGKIPVGVLYLDQRQQPDDRRDEMTNHIERVRYDGGWIEFDWSTGVMRAEWDNGYTETWSGRGYNLKARADGFLLFTEQFDRLYAAS